MSEIDKKFIETVEYNHFRTNIDTGANPNALFIWNIVRNHVGLPVLHVNDLAAWCFTHKKYHHIREDYGCMRNA
jgi:hypothetical protein